QYSAESLLDEGEWFSVERFSEQAYFPNYIARRFTSANFSKLTSDEFDKISLLLSVQDDCLCYQRVVPSSMLRKRFIKFNRPDEVAELEEPSTRILVGPEPDAIYERRSDELLFRDLARVSPMFPGIETLHREATDDQVQEFLRLDFVTSVGFDVSNVSRPNRKRISLALKSLSEMTDQQRADIVKYIRDYQGETLEYDSVSDRFTITSDEDVKNIAFGVEERFYTTLVGRERRLANCVVRI